MCIGKFLSVCSALGSISSRFASPRSLPQLGGGQTTALPKRLEIEPRSACARREWIPS